MRAKNLLARLRHLKLTGQRRDEDGYHLVWEGSQEGRKRVCPICEGRGFFYEAEGDDDVAGMVCDCEL